MPDIQNTQTEQVRIIADFQYIAYAALQLFIERSSGLIMLLMELPRGAKLGVLGVNYFPALFMSLIGIYQEIFYEPWMTSQALRQQSFELRA